MIDVPVLIVGAGPVGLALAGDLARRGIRSHAVERSDGSILQPKMDLVNVRSMEFCRRWGIVDRVEASAYPRDVQLDSIIVTSLTGYELGRFKSPPLNETPYPPQSPQRRERCPQDMFDPILAKWVSELPEATLSYRTELESFEEHDGSVVAHVIDLETQVRRTIVCRYLAGCDGASSIVAKTLGIEKVGQRGLTTTTNVVFRCPELLQLHDKGEAYRYMIVGHEGVWATLVLISSGEDWRISIVRTPPAGLTEEEIGAAIRRAVGCDFAFTVKSVMNWTRSELVAEHYGTKRVFIVGDAAHVMSPTGGFGMNTGLADAVDLSWKLAAVLDGWGAPGLLASYTAERRPVAVTNAKESSGNLARMLSVSDLPPLLAEASPAGDAYRRTFGAEFSALVSHEWRSIGIQLGYRYDDSPICWPDGTPAPPIAVEEYEQIARPGARAPHVWLRPGVSTLDLFGSGFVVLRFNRDANIRALTQAADAAGVPLVVEEIDDPAALAIYQRDLVIVRPDGHVAWRGNTIPVDPRALFDCLRGESRRARKES